jgi:hypothetical protein
VARGLGGDAEAALRRIADGLDNVVGVRDAHERRGSLVMGEVEGLT